MRGKLRELQIVGLIAENPYQNIIILVHKVSELTHLKESYLFVVSQAGNCYPCIVLILSISHLTRQSSV